MRLIFLFLIVVLVSHSMFDKGSERLLLVKKVLLKRGISSQRVDTILQSQQALHTEEKVISIISDIKNIKKHTKSEEKANKKMLLKKALVKRHLKKYKKIYDKVEIDFGVNREIVAAILQKETALGYFKAYKYNALSVFVSLLKGLEPEKYEGRQKIRLERFISFAHKNLVALISFYELQGKDVLKADLRSSYAGAIGIPQFSPMHFDMIVSPYENRKVDLHDMEVAIYSTANLLKNRFKWDKKLQFSKLDKLDTIIKRWKVFDTGICNFVYEKNLDGIKVPTFVSSVSAYKKDDAVRYVASYIKVLKRYNFSTSYALGILQIAKASSE